ncbi:hypothetical protein C8R45DRAFT_923886 [Mycena sanguinolenta]|nr:hypothetical protein C8R45DRAFT_923886 [Mycena sanguinolenta]
MKNCGKRVELELSRSGSVKKVRRTARNTPCALLLHLRKQKAISTGFHCGERTKGQDKERYMEMKAKRRPRKRRRKKATTPSRKKKKKKKKGRVQSAPARKTNTRKREGRRAKGKRPNTYPHSQIQAQASGRKRSQTQTQRSSAKARQTRKAPKPRVKRREGKKPANTQSVNAICFTVVSGAFAFSSFQRHRQAVVIHLCLRGVDGKVETNVGRAWGSRTRTYFRGTRMRVRGERGGGWIPERTLASIRKEKNSVHEEGEQNTASRNIRNDGWSAHARTASHPSPSVD